MSLKNTATRLSVRSGGPDLSACALLTPNPSKGSAFFIRGKLDTFLYIIPMNTSQKCSKQLLPQRKEKRLVQARFCL